MINSSRFHYEGEDYQRRVDKLFRGRNRGMVPKLSTLIWDLRDYWPLTVRQCYYQLVVALLIENNENEYKYTSRMMTTMRRNNLLPWGAIEDRTRRTTDKRGVPNMADFIQEQCEYFLDPRYYHRCRVQEQENYLEIATEKDALASIMEDVTWPYCTRLNVVKGQVSADMVKKMSERFHKAFSKGQKPVMLYFGDLDPSGVAIPKALKRNLEDHHNVQLQLVRVALNPDHIDEYDLPVSVDAAKKSDPNYKAWLREYGNTPATELDALHPRDLRELLESSIEKHLDMSSYREQMEIERDERAKLKNIRFDVMNYAHHQYPGLFGQIFC